MPTSLSAPTVIPTDHLELDVTMELALYNFQYGLSKIRHALQYAGGGEVSFVPTSDLSTTSNRTRWRSGFGYGGLLTWSSRTPIQFPELRPNGCGVLLTKQTQPFDFSLIKERIAKARKLFREDWDYHKPNHFIGFYRCRDNWFLLIHGGTSSIRNLLGLFEGEKTDPNFRIYKACEQIQTPDGPFFILRSGAAEDYYAKFKEAESEILRRRENLAGYLCPNTEIAFHRTHQGLVSPTAMALGSYLLDDPSLKVPFMISHGEPLFLLRGGFPVEPPMTLSLQMTVPAKRLHISPHGSGDYLVDVQGFRCIRWRDKRLFEFRLAGGNHVVAESPCGLREGHRSTQEASHALAKLKVIIEDRLEHLATAKDSPRS